MLEKNEVKKDLYKSKVNAHFTHYCYGNLYYNVIVMGKTYQFPIKTVEKEDNEYGVRFLVLSSDLGTTTFQNEIKGSDLIRYISKAIDENTFVEINQ